MSKVQLIAIAAAVGSLLLPSVQNLLATAFGYVEWRLKKLVEKAKARKRKEDDQDGCNT